MGPLPAFFYPAFQLMDYGVHSWDVRQGTGRAHGLSGDAADLLTPFMFVLWKYTDSGTEAPTVRDRRPDHQRTERRGDPRVRRLGRDGLRPGDLSGVPDGVLEFDPGSFVLTAFGRSNAGTIRGDRAVADRVPQRVLPDLGPATDIWHRISSMQAQATVKARPAGVNSWST